METTSEEQQEIYREAIEHRDALLDIQAILATKSGLRFFKYLFRTLSVGEVPVPFMEGMHLHEYLGHLRAGNAIFKLTAEANSQIAGQLLAALEKDRLNEKLSDERNRK